MFPTRGRGAQIVAALIVARHVVAFVATPIAGVVADRFDRGRVMIAADLLRVIVAGSFWFVRGPEDVVLVFVLSLLLLEARAICFEPARGAAMPQLLPENKLYAANALGRATWSSMLALGAFFGGVTSALLGRPRRSRSTRAAFAVSAMFMYLARIPGLPRNADGAPQPHPLRDFQVGMADLRDHLAQRSLLVLEPGALFPGGFFVLVPRSPIACSPATRR